MMLHWMQVRADGDRVVPMGHWQDEFVSWNVGSGHWHVGDGRRMRLLGHNWQMFADGHSWQLYNVQVMQVPENWVVPFGQIQLPWLMMNGLGHPQTLLFSVRFPIQIEHILTPEQPRQFTIEQFTQVPPAKLFPFTQTQYPLTITKLLSGHPHKLPLKVRFPIQFSQTFTEEQDRQFVMLQSMQVSVKKVF
jgi:hypothetical protein